jgi:ABC-type multidrug transport system fused ATPase/permease subunit
MALAATDFPLLNVFLTMMWFFLFVTWLMLLFRVFADVFRSDMGGVSKALWVVFVIALPFLGVLAYLIARGPRMAQRELQEVAAHEEAAREYIRTVAGDGASPAEELARLLDLRDRGALDETEYAAMKAKILA